MLFLFFFFFYSVLEGGEKGSLPVVATVFDKLNQVYKDYLEAEQSYTVVSEVWCRREKNILFCSEQESLFHIVDKVDK